jgi:flagellar hook protein FlgE
MYSGFSTALSALTADTTAINVVGNNLANLNTTGFKASEIDFSTLMAQSLGVGSSNGQVGMGVAQVDAVQNFTQGSMTNTNGPLDCALQGSGFFVVTDSSNNQLYTRDGSFQLDASGNLLTATGQNVQGWTAVDGVVDTNGAIGNITVPVGSVVPPVATANMSMDINLNSQAVTGAASGTFTAPIQVYDSQGTAHTLSVTFTQSAANNWGYTVTIPATDVGQTGDPVSLATGTLTFDGNGNLSSPAAATPPAPNTPVAITTSSLTDQATLNVNWNLFNSAGTPTITQYAQTSAMSNPTQDGNAPGQVSNVAIQNGGLMVATYTNGQQMTLGQLAVASIANPTSLLQVGDNNLQASAATAQAALGAAGAGGRGTIVGGSLEASTTDMASQFTQLLTFERSYQAASRVISTDDQLLQETVNLIHP